MTAATDGVGPAYGAADDPFERYGPDAVRELVRDYPLAWVVASGDDGPEAALLPLLGDYDAQGRLVALIGHLARRNPLARAMAADGRALILFNGPSGYISPADAGRRDWAPTWNYAQLRIEAQITLAPAETDAFVRRLVTQMEAAQDDPWAVEALGARYRTMLPQIVGFRAQVTRVRGRFKLGQDEAPATARAIIARNRQPGLAAWMTQFNRDRL